MAKGAYIGVEGKAEKIKAGYIGIRRDDFIDFVGILGEDYTNTVDGVTVTIEDGYAVLKGRHTYSGSSSVLRGKSNYTFTIPAGSYYVDPMLQILMTWYGEDGRSVTDYCSGSFTVTSAASVGQFFIRITGVQDVDMRVRLALFSQEATARRIKKAYIGVDGTAELVWSAE